MLSNVYAQIVLFVAVIAGYVALSLGHVETLGYVSLVTPVLGAVFVVSRLDQRSDSQDQQLATITSQTNGVLTRRIQTAVAAALDERDRGGAAPVVPGPAPDTPGV